MRNHRWILHVITQARNAPAKGLAGARQADPLAWTARGILILVMAVGSVGPEAMIMPGHAEAGHARAHHSAHHSAVSSQPAKSGHNRGTAWMY